MIVRLAVAADHEAVLRIVQAIPGLPQWKPQDLAQAPDGTVPTSIHRVLLVAEDGHGICGFAQTAVAAAEAELEGMAVTESNRGQGIGRALLGACLHWAAHAGAGLFRLEVRTGNTSAIRLYRSAGLQAVGTRRSYYSHPAEDALLMQRNLESVPQDTEQLPVSSESYGP